VPESDRRREAWRIARDAASRAQAAGFSGVILMGLRFETVVGEAHEMWYATRRTEDALAPTVS
jgi:hypothetical protein